MRASVRPPTINPNVGPITISGQTSPENLRKALPWLPTAKKLVTIQTDGDLSAQVPELDALRMQTPDSGKVRDLFTRWEFKGPSGWQTTDRIELPVIRGGREDGWRTFARKSTFQPGRWRVTAETDDGRAIATVSFDVEQDADTDERVLLIREG